MARLRVHELAKELGVESKEILAKLREQGEFVKSASSMLEIPVIRKVKELFPAPPPPAEVSQPVVAEDKPAAPTADVPATPASGDTKSASGADAAVDAGTAPADGGAGQAGTAAVVEAKPAVRPRPAKKAPAASKATSAELATPVVVPVPGGSTGPAQADSQAKPGEARPTQPEAQTQEVAAVGGEVEDSALSTTKSEQAVATAEAGPETVKPPAPAENVAAVHFSANKKPAPMPGPRAARPGGGSERGGNRPAGAKSARPGNNPYATSQGMPRPAPPRGAGRGGAGGPRPGNNPFAAAQGMPRPGGGGGAGGGARGGAPRNRPIVNPEATNAPAMAGAPVETPGVAPTRGRRGRAGNAPSSPATATGPGAFGAPSAPPRGGRGGGRGATQGAFGRQGGKPVKGRKSKRAKRQEFEDQSAPSIGGVQIPRGDGTTEVRIRAGASLADFADKIDVNPASLVTVMFHLGEMATATQSLDEDTFQALGAELGYVIKIVSPEDEDRELLGTFAIDLEAEELEDEELSITRPPVVTVMGHVDHGKTKLLDAIRHTDVVGDEFGGITQHIGAYQVKVRNPIEYRGRAITFIDTPGHEAFTAMRARGAKVTDIAILVVAADDGVMPQTVEAINHAQAANVPIVVAVNKIDKPEANPDKIRAQLTEFGLVAEEYGGDVIFVNVSARERIGIGDLLEAIIITTDGALDLRANPEAPARGVAIEANLDKGRGAVATVLVERGTLRVGDSIVAGTAYGRVRAMFNEHGEPVEQAEPARPVQVLGLTSVPRAGDSFLVASDDRTARQIADKRQAVERAAQLAKRRKRITLEDFDAALKEGKVETLNLILKGDVSGAVEALEDSLLKIDVGEEVQLRIIHRGVGAITQNDVNLATVDKAVIIGFNVRPAERVGEMADREGVEIKYYSVIYNALEEIESAMKGMLKPVYEEAQLGTAEIRQVFRSSKFGNIAGSLVRSGTIRRGTKARITRNGVVMAENLEISSLRREKDDVVEVREGYECGIGLGFKDIQEGDMVETWELREVKRD